MAKEISSELLNTILTRVGGPGNIASCGNCMDAPASGCT